MSEFSLNVGDNIEILAGEFPVRKLSKETYERLYLYELTDGEQPMMVEQERIKCKKEK